MSHAFVHLELNTDDVSAAKEFYRALFGWSFTDMRMGDSVYTSLETGTPPGGGVQLKQMPDAPTMWLPYVAVGDVAAAVAKARSLGAEIIVEHMAIAGFGALGILRDPSGAALGLWQVEPGSGDGERKRGKGKRGDKKRSKKPARGGDEAGKAEKKAKKKAEKQAKQAARKAEKKAERAKKAEKKAEKQAKQAGRKAEKQAKQAARKAEQKAKKRDDKVAPDSERRKKGRRH